MKQFIRLSLLLFFSFLVTSCNFMTDGKYTIKRVRDHLDLKYDETSKLYQLKWYVLKYDDDVQFYSDDEILIKLSGYPHQTIPAVHTYLTEYKDPNFVTKEFADKAKNDKNYVSSASQWIQLTDEQLLFTSASGSYEFEKELSFVPKEDLISYTNFVFFLYVNPEDLPDDYFDYWDQQVENAKTEAMNKAQEKADKKNKKDKLSEGDEGYHTAKEYYDSIYKTLLEEIGEKRIIINDVKLRIDITNKIH